MITTTWLRVLRLKYHITLNEIADAAQVSNQYLSTIERGQERASEEQKARIVQAFGELIEKKQSANRALKKEYSRHRYYLLRPMEAEHDEF